MKNKAGRKRKDWSDKLTGKPVEGLTRRPDGRWRIIGTHITFRESDEQEAIKKFRQLTSRQKTTAWDSPRSEPFSKIEKLAAAWDELTEHEIKMMPSHIFGRFFLDPALDDKTHQLWKFFAVQIATRPQWLAEATGIEQLAYLTDLQPPEKLPTMKELQDTWEKHARCSPEQIRKCSKGFEHFVDATDVSELKDITPQVVVEYQDVLHGSGYAPKQQKHTINGIRRVLTFSRSRAVAIDAITKTLSYLKILVPNGNAKTIDPKPIEVAEWKKLLAKAVGDDLAMVLLMLNGSFYLGEVIELEWSDIKDGCIITSREKTGQCIRVCTLWKETINALAKVERKGDKIFYTYAGLPIKRCGAFRRFKELRDRAELKVSASQLRDGAYSASVAAGVSFQFCQLLNGHATGMADHYVLRNPEMVRPACDAVYKHYFSKRK